MAFRLATVWEHPHQAQLSSLDEAAKNLTLLINLSDNWTYAFEWLNEDVQHAPLSNEGHISTMINGVPKRSTCRCLHQLELHKLLQCGGQVVYPKGLNGGFELVQTSLSGSLNPGVDLLGKPTCEPSFQLVDLSQATLGDCTPRPQLPTEPQHHLPLHILPQSVPAAQLPTPVWPLSFTNSCLG